MSSDIARKHTQAMFGVPEMAFPAPFLCKRTTKELAYKVVSSPPMAMCTSQVADFATDDVNWCGIYVLGGEWTVREFNAKMGTGVAFDASRWGSSAREYVWGNDGATVYATNQACYEAFRRACRA